MAFLSEIKQSPFGSVAASLRLLFQALFGLTSSSKQRQRFRNRLCVGRGHSPLKKRRERPGAAVFPVELHDIFMAVLMVNNISMSTMGLPAPPPSSSLTPPPRLVFFSHTHAQQREKKMTSPQLTIHCTSIGLNGAAQQKVT